MYKLKNYSNKLFIKISNFDIFRKNKMQYPIGFYFSTQQELKKEGVNPAKQNQEELKPEAFVPFEKLTPEKMIEIKKKNLKETYYYFGNEKNKLAEKKYNVMDFYSKKLRRDYVRSGEIDSHKHIIPVKRLRDKSDTIETLNKKKEIAAVIEGRDEFQDIDIVLDKSFTDKLKK